MVFGLKESTKGKVCEKSDMSLVESLFQALKGVNLPLWNILDWINGARLEKPEKM